MRRPRLWKGTTAWRGRLGVLWGPWGDGRSRGLGLRGRRSCLHHLEPEMGRSGTRRAAPVRPFGQYGPCQAPPPAGQPSLQVRVPRRGAGLGRWACAGRGQAGSAESLEGKARAGGGEQAAQDTSPWRGPAPTFPGLFCSQILSPLYPARSKQAASYALDPLSVSQPQPPCLHCPPGSPPPARALHRLPKGFPGGGGWSVGEGPPAGPPLSEGRRVLANSVKSSGTGVMRTGAQGRLGGGAERARGKAVEPAGAAAHVVTVRAHQEPAGKAQTFPGGKRKVPDHTDVGQSLKQADRCFSNVMQNKQCQANQASHLRARPEQPRLPAAFILAPGDGTAAALTSGSKVSLPRL